MYQYKSKYGIFVFDPEKETIFESIYIISKSPRNKYRLKSMLRQPFFIDNKKNKCKLPKDRLKFFTDFIPRVLGIINPEFEKVDKNGNIKKVDISEIIDTIYHS